MGLRRIQLPRCGGGSNVRFVPEADLSRSGVNSCRRTLGGGALDQPFPAYQGDEPYVFVCYAHDDEQLFFLGVPRYKQGLFACELMARYASMHPPNEVQRGASNANSVVFHHNSFSPSSTPHFSDRIHHVELPPRRMSKIRRMDRLCCDHGRNRSPENPGRGAGRTSGG